MKRKKLVLLAIILALSVLMTSAFSVTASAAGKGKITISSAQAKAGGTVEVTISMTTNPGMATAEFEIQFNSDILTLTNVKDEGFITTNDAQSAGPVHSDQKISPYHLSWCNDLAKSNITKTGKMVTLTFKVSDNAKAGTYDIKVDPKTVEIYDYNIKDVAFDFVNGSVTVSSGTSYKVGDVNGDGAVNGADSGLLKRYTAGWKDYDKKIVNWDAADINRDGKVNGADSGLLKRYTAGWKGYDKYIITIT